MAIFSAKQKHADKTNKEKINTIFFRIISIIIYFIMSYINKTIYKCQVNFEIRFFPYSPSSNFLFLPSFAKRGLGEILIPSRVSLCQGRRNSKSPYHFDYLIQKLLAPSTFHIDALDLKNHLHTYIRLYTLSLPI